MTIDPWIPEIVGGLQEKGDCFEELPDLPQEVRDVLLAVQRSKVRAHHIHISGSMGDLSAMGYSTTGLHEAVQPVPSDAEFVVVITGVHLAQITQYYVCQLQAQAALPPIIVVVTCPMDLDPRLLLAAYTALRNVNVADVVLRSSTFEELHVALAMSVYRVREDRQLATRHKNVVQEIQMKTNNLFWPHVHKIFPGFPKMEPGVLQPPREGASIGYYYFSKLLGSGSLTNVYRALDQRTSREIAMKVILKDVIQDSRQVRTLWNEWYWLSRLQHEHIVKIHDWIHTQNHVHICLEFGGPFTLGYLIQSSESGRLRSTVAMPMVKQLADALGYCHEFGVVHRDMRPDKIAVSDDKVMLIDFGMAAAKGAQHEVCAPGGSLPFVAPEVLLEESHDAAIADVWSLGAVALTMLCGSERVSQMLECAQLTLSREHALRLRAFFADPSRLAHNVEPLVEHPDVLSLLRGSLHTVPEQRLTARDIEARLGHAGHHFRDPGDGGERVGSVELAECAEHAEYVEGERAKHAVRVDFSESDSRCCECKTQDPCAQDG